MIRSRNDNLATKPAWWSSDHWATPREIVDQLEAEFGAFDLDPCCRPETAKAPRFYTPEDNGLDLPWAGRVFLNPPYSNPAPWLKKAIAETSAGIVPLVVALLPVRTDTRWFHELVKGQVSELRFIRGRVKWIGWHGTPIPNPKDPSMLAIYQRTRFECPNCGGDRLTTRYVGPVAHNSCATCLFEFRYLPLSEGGRSE